MIGGVLVERTVKEVVPSLETNNAGVRASLASPDALYLQHVHRADLLLLVLVVVVCVVFTDPSSAGNVDRTVQVSGDGV